jgi:hypothetical protein
LTSKGPLQKRYCRFFRARRFAAALYASSTEPGLQPIAGCIVTIDYQDGAKVESGLVRPDDIPARNVAKGVMSHVSAVVAFDARWHVDAVCAKPAVPKISPPAASSRDKFLCPPASSAALQPSVHTAFRRAM